MVGKRERRKAENRAAIIAAARKVFAREGFEGAGVRDVIRETNLAAGTFYNYFIDKEAVFRAVLEETTLEIRRRLSSVRADARTLEEFVSRAYEAWFRFMAEDEIMLALVERNAATIRAMLGDPILGAGVDDLYADVRAAIDRGDLPRLDAEYLTGAMVGVALELAIRMVARQPADVEGAAGFASDLFLGGIARAGRAQNG